MNEFEGLNIDSAALPDLSSRYASATITSSNSRRVVLRATDPRSGQRVFIKHLASGQPTDAEHVAAFYREPTCLQRLSPHSPLLVTVLDIGRWGDRPCFVQPWLEGWSLAGAMARGKPFDILGTLHVMEECLKALTTIHGEGFVHGDVSPENVFVVTTSSPLLGKLPVNASIRLVDFESVRSIALQEKPQLVIGKPAYMSPEVARGEQPSARADLFSLGVMAWELFTGSRPYAVSTVADAADLAANASGATQSPASLPAPLEQLLRSMIAVTASDRPLDAKTCLQQVQTMRALLAWMEGRQGASSGSGKEPAAGPFLVVESSDGGSRHDLLKTRMVIGRDDVCDIRLDHSSVSRQHAELTRDTLGRWWVKDLQSRNGVIVNGKNVTERQLKHNDQITISGITLRFKASATSAAEVPDDSDDAPEFRRTEISTVAKIPVPSKKGTGELAQFSVVAPASVEPGRTFLLEVWMYVEAERDEVLKQIERRTRNVIALPRGLHGGADGTDFTVVLQIDPLECEDACESLVWNGDISSVAFLVKAPGDLRSGPYAGKVKILQNGLLIVRLMFEISVGKHVEQPGSLQVQQQQLKSAFASYAHEDQAEVFRRVQGISAAGIQVFLDVLSLRAGQLWENVVTEKIRSSETFFLFWSAHAKASEWVEKEWRLALANRGLQYIHPVPLVSPAEASPPQELRQLHFNDLFLASIRATEKK
jgi:serine/threonine-protein kinase